MTFEFSKLPFAVAIAYVAFGEVIDAWTWIGAPPSTSRDGRHA